jgi:hypothetical protein
MSKEQVRIMQRNSAGQVFAEQPRENPRGMGVAGILTSEMFGLRSALDLDTQGKLDRQRVLGAKEPEKLTPQERQDLTSLTSELDEMGFMMLESDPLYAEFMKRFTMREDEALREKITLTPEQRRERLSLIDDIVKELIAEGRW